MLAAINVSKRFRKTGAHGSLVKRALDHLLARPVEGFWALQDVSFEVQPGEILGIVGPNGSGKSTMLKLLAGIMEPTTGSIKAEGRIAPLIEVGAGFHPELTGLENIYLNGTIMGLKRQEIRRNLDAIVAFSGLEQFLEVPVKHYSSGMYMRLGFAVAVHLNPQIVLVDEVLAVGDKSFQHNCLEKIREMRRQGVSILIVSHNLFTVAGLCQRALVLAAGRPIFLGPAHEAILAYEAMLRSEQLGRLPSGTEPGGLQVDAVVRIVQLEVPGCPVSRRPHFLTGQDVTVLVQLHATQKVRSPCFAVAITRADGLACAASNTVVEGVQTEDVAEGRFAVELHLPRLRLIPGAYSMIISVCNYDLTAELDRRVFSFEVSCDIPNLDEDNYGVFLLENRWRRVLPSDDLEDGPAQTVTPVPAHTSQNGQSA